MSNVASNKSKKYTQEQILQMIDTIHGIAGEFWGILVKQVCETVREVEANRQSSSQAASEAKPSQPPEQKPEPKPTDPKPSLQRYFRKKAAAEYLGVSVRTVDRFLARRIITCYKPDKLSLFRKEDLDAAMERYRINAVGEDFRR